MVYLTVGEIGGTAMARSFNGTWWSYTGGQALTGAMASEHAQ